MIPSSPALPSSTIPGHNNDSTAIGSSSSGVNVAGIDDIGLLLRFMPQSRITSLSSDCKHALEINHFRLDGSYKFPSRFLDGCNRSCQLKYFMENPWFVYSKVEDGIFCLPCVFFSTKPDPCRFVTTKFNTWSKKSRKFAEHNSVEYHKLSLVRMEALKSSMTRENTSIQDHLKRISSEEIASNRYIIKCMVDAILLCGKQCLGLCGHRDDGSVDPDTNKGNFLALLDYSVRSGNTALEKHLSDSAKNALYNSKTIQNQLIECIGNQIRDGIIKEIKLAKWYSILCDEVTDISMKEQLSFVIRFVDNNCCIREEFLDFIYTDRITGEVLATKIKDALLRYGIQFENCRGQGYDGGANMSATRGVQGRLLVENPKAIYMHCNAHILNLCIVHACGLPAIRNMNSTITETANFFSNSAKRQAFLETLVDNEISTVKVKDLCRTRWVYRHEAYTNFFILFKHLVSVMESIVSHEEKYGIMNWDANTVVLANGLLKMFTSFSFIVAFTATMNAMAIIKPISIKLQFRNKDVLKAYQEVKNVIEELKLLRLSDTMLHSVYEQLKH